MTSVVILDAIRTPIGKLRGGLSGVRPDDLAATCIEGLLLRNPEVSPHVEEVIFGDTNQAGEDNRNVARMAAILAGLPYEVTGVTVNRLCGSGLEAIIQASRAVRAGDHEVVVAGGVESMSRAPYSMEKPTEAFPRKPPRIYDTSLGWRYPNPKMEARFPLHSMGQTAENVAERYGVSRADQDAFALESHLKASAAWESGQFAAEVMDVTVPPAHRKAKETVVARDESIRPDSNLDALGRLKPVFKADGSVTAGNSSPLNDGASALIVASADWAKARGLSYLAEITASAVAGVEPNFMGIGPVPATQKVLARSGLEVGDLELIELNEAFAAQSLACVRELGLPLEKTNVHGGAIALGHPIGCSGARIVTTLAHGMKSRDARVGLAALCIGVGQGLALTLKR